MKTINQIIELTNNKISNWYKNALIDFGVNGSGEARIENNEFIVDYTENGIKKTWSMAFYPEYIQENEPTWFFDCWAELA